MRLTITPLVLVFAACSAPLPIASLVPQSDHDVDLSPYLDTTPREQDTVPVNPDPDGDGLSTEQEVGLGTNPYHADTDGDAIDDGDEIALGTNPLLADSDADGIDDGDELELGTHPLLADTDADGIDDGTELVVGTDPLHSDTDGDGLLDGDELELATDPLAADTDRDGWEDGEEATAATDPTNKWDWPLDTGRWPDFSDSAPTPSSTGWQLGDTTSNWSATDQFGNTIEIYDLAGYVVLVDLSAGWCGPCRTVASHANDLWEKYRLDGFIIVHLLIDDDEYDTVVEDPDFLTTWASEYDIHFPVTTDPDHEAFAGLYYEGPMSGLIPFMVLIDRDMVFTETFIGSDSEADIVASVEALLEE